MQLLIVMVFQCAYISPKSTKVIINLKQMKRGSLQTRHTLFEDNKGVIRTHKEGQTTQWPTEK